MKIRNIIFYFIICIFILEVKANASEEFILNKNNINLFRGQSTTLEATFPEGSEDYIAEWTLEKDGAESQSGVNIQKNRLENNKCVVNVSDYYPDYGNYTITAISNTGSKQTCRLFVPSFEELFGIDETFKYICVGDTVNLKPRYELDDDFQIISSDENILKIDDNNLLTVVGVGSARISITQNCYVWFYTCDLKQFEIDRTSLTLNVNEVATLNVTLDYSEGSIVNLYWTSSDANIVKTIVGVDKNKTICISGIKKGKATITVQAGNNGETRTCEVEVVEPSKSITLNKESLNLNVGESYKLEAQVLPETTSYPDVKWSSSDEDIVTVDSEGNAKTVAPGIAKVIAETEDGTINSCIVLVLGKQLPITTIPYTSMMKFNTKTLINSIVNTSNFPVLENDYKIKIYNAKGNLKDITDIIGSKDKIQVIDNYGDTVSEFTVVVPGDVTGNGSARMYDSFEILKGAISGNKGLDEIDIEIRDFNNDGNVRMYDAFQFLKQAILGK